MGTPFCSHNGGFLTTLRLVALRVILLAIAVGGFVALAPSVALGQATGQVTFEVAAVKLLSGPSNFDLQVLPDRVTLRGATLGFCVRWAYGLQAYQPYQTRGPEWFEVGPSASRYDIVAKAAGPVPQLQLRLMMRALLAEKFRLVLHRERKEMPVYVLSTFTGAVKLAPAGDGNASGEIVSQPAGLVFRGANTAKLVEVMAQFVQQLIVDETRLDGSYDFTVDLFRYRDYAVVDGNRRQDMASAFSRALNDLGLKLEPAKRMVDVIVVDHVEKEPIAD